MNIAGAIKTKMIVHIAILILLPVIIYVQSLGFDYTNFDDNGIIQQKFAVIGNIHAIDTAFKTDPFINATGDFYRPVQTISYMVDAHFSRDKLWMFHITNLLIHILTCIALYFFLQFLELKKLTAFILALVFAVHPLFASGVAWVPSRGDILIGLEGILLFMTFGYYFKTKNVIYLVLHVLLFLVTIFTKETTVVFPLFFMYYYFLILKEKFNLKRLLPFFISWAAIFIFFFKLRSKVVANTGANMDVLGIISFFKNNTVIPTIIGKFFVPFNLSTLPLYDNTTTIIGVFFLLAMAYLTFEYSIEKKWAVLMGLLWFVLFVIPPTIYRLQNADTFFNYLEHRTYLPAIGLIIILGFFLDDHLEEKKFRVVFTWLYIPVIIIFMVLAWIHCGDYKNNFTLSMRAASLNNPSGFSMRASDYLIKGDTTDAVGDMDKAIELSPDAGMYFQRGKIRARMLDHTGAEQDFSMALTMSPRLVDVLMARSVERRYLKRYEAAFRDIYSAIQIDSTNAKLYFSFGNLFMVVSNYNGALISYSKAISLQPAYADAYNNRAFVKIMNGNDTGAINDCHKAIALMHDKPNPIVFNNLGQAFRDMNEPDSAFNYFNKAIAMKDNFADAYFQRGKAKQKNNDSDGACKDWNKAVSLGYTDTTGTINKFCKLSIIK
jgi:tetratricopeptide (TPR) repeat protein